MDMRAEGAPAASTRNVLRFEGSAGEYFKIWIVNLALTIVTLGIFSAWAKVRNKRYFLGNTFLGNHSFDYHGSPLRILLGRVIALALLMGYSLTINFAPKAVFVWALVFLIATPWLIKSSLRFSARNTSYRNVRFDFHGTYGGAFFAFVLWPIFAVFTLWTTLPLAHRARDYYNINNHSFGGKSFEAVIPGGKLYAIYGIALVIVLCAVALGGIAAYNSGLGHLLLQARQAKPAGRPDPKAMVPMILAFAAIYLIVLVTMLFLYSFVRTMTFNLAVSSTRLAGSYALQSNMSPFAMTWIVFSNLVVTVLTLGLMYPWARMRQSRYMVEHLSVTGPDDLDGFTSTAASQSGAIGEEVAGFFDIDFGL